ncbi:hypothetical protein ACMS05_003315, partial [Cronobacter turicensis]
KKKVFHLQQYHNKNIYHICQKEDMTPLPSNWQVALNHHPPFDTLQELEIYDLTQRNKTRCLQGSYV